MGAEKKILLPSNTQNSKCTEQKNIKREKRKSQVTYNGRLARLLYRNIKSQKILYRVHADLKRIQFQHRIRYSAKFSINIDGKTKIFQDKSKFKQYLSTSAVLRKIFKENSNTRRVPKTKGKNKTLITSQ